MNLFQRAAVGANLTAVERGIYQFAQLMLKSLGPLSLLPFISDALKSANIWLATGVWQSFDYLGDLRLLLFAVIGAGIAAWQHWQTTKFDSPLPVIPTALPTNVTATQIPNGRAGGLPANTTPNTNVASAAVITQLPAIPQPPPDVPDVAITPAS